MYEENSPNTLVINFEVLKSALAKSEKVKIFEKHILYKILVILGSDEEKEKYVLFDFDGLEALQSESSGTVYLYSFLTVRVLFNFF